MKFKIRYADQIVGVLIIIALLSLIFVVFMLGRTQRWFSRTYSYKTYMTSALGLTRNMAVTCRGYPIGNVKTFHLTDDNMVEVTFALHDQFYDRAREGSLVEMQVSPIGMGSQFIFYPGLGGELEEGSVVPMHDSPEGKAYIAQGLAYIPPHDDSIAVILSMVNAVLGDIQTTLGGLNVTPNEKAATALGQSLVNVQELTANLAADMANPNGIRKILNGDGDSINALEASLVSLAGTLDHIEKATYYLPREMPQILNLLSEARTAVKAAEDVLISLRNNPLLRNGIPEHAQIDSSGTNPRNIQF